MAHELTLHLDAAALAQLDNALPAIARSTGAHELGVEVTREVGARVVLLRGLRALGAVASGVGADATAGAVADATADAVAEATTRDASQRPEPVAPALPSNPQKRKDANGNISPPDGWKRWATGERVPAGHGDMHAYYEANGWHRWWGTVGDDGKGRETIVFYWSPREETQDLPPFDDDGEGSGAGSGASRKRLLVQPTPWGPGHVIPAGW